MASRFRDRLGSNSTILAIVAGSTLTALAGRSVYKLLSTSKRAGIVIYKAPTLGNEHIEEIPPYPNDALPGVRDVDTPYGSIRVNEWGPNDGRKVLFIHGISTPSLSCAHMALQLAKEGCRVMTFDLFGRGYSDCPDPGEFKQNIQLFSTQIMLVLGSSPISWTGSGNGFTLVGYSLGGGIAASFTSYFPSLVDTLVLIAPSGVMRTTRIQLSSRLIYGGLLPDLIRDYLVRRRIAGPTPSKTSVRQQTTDSVPADPKVENNPEAAPGSVEPILPNSTASAANTVAWQLKANPGFLPSFISSIRYAPISNQHDRWGLIGSRLDAQRAAGAVLQSGLLEGRVLLLLGKTDGVVVASEVVQDARDALGMRNVEAHVLQGGHDFVITNSEGCVEKIKQFWESGRQ